MLPIFFPFIPQISELAGTYQICSFCLLRLCSSVGGGGQLDSDTFNPKGIKTMSLLKPATR